jgi:hypothetical protein
MEMAVRSMKTAETAMEMASGALPRPGRVLEQRLLSPEICLWRRRSCGTVLGKTPTDLGFGLRKALNRRRGGVRGPPGGPHYPWARPGGWARPLMVCLPSGPPPTLVRSSVLFGKIGVLELVSSNSENISCVAFLKHKNSRKQGTDTVASCQ